MTNNQVDFGKTALDYRKHRQGFPEEFFIRLKKLGIGVKGQKILDLGTGTGTVARGFALAGSEVRALDPSENLIAQAKIIDQELGVTNTSYFIGTAENTQQPDCFFDVVAAGQCWHWFDAQKAINEIKRILKPAGKLVVAHYDWIPAKNNIADLTEALILKYNPEWQLKGSNGFYSRWVDQLVDADFVNIETCSFDVMATYTHEAWRGRIRASAGVAASLSPEKVEKFDAEFSAVLKEKFPLDPLRILHRCFMIVANLESVDITE